MFHCTAWQLQPQQDHSKPLTALRLNSPLPAFSPTRNTVPPPRSKHKIDRFADRLICAPGVRDGRQMAAEPVSSCAGPASGSQIPSSLGREPTAALLSRRSVLAGRETFTGFCPPRLLYLQQPSAGQSNPLGAALRFTSCMIPKRPHLRFEGVLQDVVRHSPRIPLPSLSRGHFILPEG